MNTLTTRDQENLTNTHHTTAANKPLNQGIRGLQPKTPGDIRTPFPPTRHDENRPFDIKGLKPVVKAGPSKLEKNTFVTPITTKGRAPLGQKTTNAKGHAFKTPGPLQQQKPEKTVKKISTIRRSARSKIHVAPSEPAPADGLQKQAEEDEPEYGYAPQNPIPLPDPPMEFGYDDSFPELQGKNLFRGYGEIYCTSPKDEDGVSLRHKREDAAYRLYIEDETRKTTEALNTIRLPTEEEVNRQVDEMLAAGPLKNRIKGSKVETIKARSAAEALSNTHSLVPSVALRETQSSLLKKKTPSSTLNKQFQLSGNPITRRAPLSPEVSRNTIGFPKAKKPPSIIPATSGSGLSSKGTKRFQIDQSKVHPRDFLKLYGEPPHESDMWFRLREYELLDTDDLFDDEDISPDLFRLDLFPIEGLDDDDEEVFQLPVPE